MANFVLNINNINNDIKILKNNIAEYKDSIISLKLNLSKVDSSWNDFNTNSFINIVKKDKNEFFEHITSMKKYIELISDFCDYLESYFEKKFYIEKVNKIKYNSDMLNSAIENLNNCYNKLNNISNILQDLVIPVAFEYKNLIKNYYFEIDKYKTSLITLKSKLSKINIDINNIVNEFKTKRNDIDFKTINSQKIEYNWKNYGFTNINNKNNVKVYKKNSSKFSKKMKIKLSNNFNSKKVYIGNNTSINAKLEDLKYTAFNSTLLTDNKVDDNIIENKKVLNFNVGESENNIKVNSVTNNISNSTENFNSIENQVNTNMDLKFTNSIKKENSTNNSLKVELVETKNNNVIQSLDSSNKTINLNDNSKFL